MFYDERYGVVRLGRPDIEAGVGILGFGLRGGDYTTYLYFFGEVVR